MVLYTEVDSSGMAIQKFKSLSMRKSFMFGQRFVTMCHLAIFFRQIFELRHEISNIVVCATSKGSDQPAHTRSLIRAFACGLNILELLSY